MLERVCRKRNTLTLFVAIQTDTATMENRVEIPSKTGNRTAVNPTIPLLGIHTEETRIERDTGTPVITVALLQKLEYRNNLDVH